jgi:hypothetical protein
MLTCDDVGCVFLCVYTYIHILSFMITTLWTPSARRMCVCVRARVRERETETETETERQRQRECVCLNVCVYTHILNVCIYIHIFGGYSSIRTLDVH